MHGILHHIRESAEANCAMHGTNKVMPDSYTIPYIKSKVFYGGITEGRFPLEYIPLGLYTAAQDRRIHARFTEIFETA